MGAVLYKIIKSSLYSLLLHSQFKTQHKYNQTFFHEYTNLVFLLLGDKFSYHNQMMFSTKNHDNDAYGGSCPQLYHGGWWYNACHTTNLNGLYAPSALNNSKYIGWRYFRGKSEALKSTQMMIRP